MDTLSTASLSKSDEELMLQVQAMNESALAIILRRHTRLLRTVMDRIVHNETDVDDLLQEITIELWNHSKKYDPAKGKLLGWLVTLARRRSIDRMRRRQTYVRAVERLQTEQEYLPPQTWITLPENVGRDHSKLILETMKKCMPAAQCKCVSLAYFRGLTQREIADKTKTPLGTIKTRLELGTRKLRNALEALGIHSSYN